MNTISSTGPICELGLDKDVIETLQLLATHQPNFRSRVKDYAFSIIQAAFSNTSKV